MAKQTWSGKMLFEMYRDASKNNPLESDSYKSLELLADVNRKIVNRTLKEFAEFFDKNDFAETSYNEAPDYYATVRKWRGCEIRESDDLCEESHILFWEAWSMSDHYSEVDRQRFTELLPNHAEDLGLTILCPHTQAEKSWENGHLDIAKEEIYWGNTAILSEEDWDKCYDIDIDQYVDLVWHDVRYFDISSVISVFEAIDEEVEWWNGDEGVLYSIEQMLNDEKFRLQGMLAVNEITRAYFAHKQSYVNARERVLKIVKKYEDLHYNFYSE